MRFFHSSLSRFSFLCSSLECRKWFKLSLNIHDNLSQSMHNITWLTFRLFYRWKRDKVSEGREKALAEKWKKSLSHRIQFLETETQMKMLNIRRHWPNAAFFHKPNVGVGRHKLTKIDTKLKGSSLFPSMMSYDINGKWPQRDVKVKEKYFDNFQNLIFNTKWQKNKIFSTS